jgi:hypothetical protein
MMFLSRTAGDSVLEIRRNTGFLKTDYCPGVNETRQVNMQGTGGDPNRRMENKDKEKRFKLPTNKRLLKRTAPH